MVLTDPPYGTTNAPWDTAPDWDKLFAELWRVLKRNGALLMFSQMPVAADIVAQQRKNFRYQWVWEKTQPAGFLNAHKMPMRTHEVILVFYRALPTYNAMPIASQRGNPRIAKIAETKTALYGKKKATIICGSDGALFPRDVVRFSRPANNERLHPTQKPVETVKIQAYLKKEHVEKLDAECAKQDVSRAELIRRLIENM